MRQTWAILTAITSAAVLLSAGCDDRKTAAAAGGIVSLTPAGTDLLLAMGQGASIVGISSYEPNEDLRRRLPKLGDYFRVDFERMAELRPAFLLIQGKRYRMPTGTREKCHDLGVVPIILQIDRLDDIKIALRQIGEAIDRKAAAERAVTDMETREKKLFAQKNGEPVSAAMVFGDGGTSVVGSDTFLDDALTLAGGRNVVTAGGYPAIDAEKMRELAPNVVFLMLPGADDAVVRRATAALPPGPAGRRVIPLTESNVLMPGTQTVHLAEVMAGHLRPDLSRAGG